MRNRKHNTWKVIGIIIACALIGTLTSYGFSQLRHLPHHPTDDTAKLTPSQPFQQQNHHTTNDKTARSDKKKIVSPPTDKNLKRPLAFLVVGIDERKHDSGRADTIIVFTANPTDKTIKMVSIPRDTKTEIADVVTHSHDKINHAYSRGNGLESTKKTVEQFLAIPIDYTVSVNMKGFEQLVDIFDGVHVDVPHDFTMNGFQYRKGPMTLNGEKALYYVRERKSSSDFNRNVRQQQVLRSLIDQSSRFSTITKIDDILRIIGNNVDTDLTPLQLFQLQRLYGKVQEKDIQRLELTGTDEWSDAYYFIVNEQKKKEVIETLHTHLQLN